MFTKCCAVSRKLYACDRLLVRILCEFAVFVHMRVYTVTDPLTDRLDQENKNLITLHPTPCSSVRRRCNIKPEDDSLLPGKSADLTFPHSRLPINMGSLKRRNTVFESPANISQHTLRFISRVLLRPNYGRPD